MHFLPPEIKAQHPNQVGSYVAERINRYPDEAPSLLRELGNVAFAQQKKIAAFHYNPSRATYRILRSQHRAAVAPLVHGIEQQLADNIQQDGWLAGLDAGTIHTAHCMTKQLYGEFSNQSGHFVRLMGALAYRAAHAFLARTLNGPDRHYMPLLELFSRQHSYVDALSNDDDSVLIPSRERQHIPLHTAVETSVTALQVIKPAIAHAKLWAPDAPIADTLLEHARDLGKLAEAPLGFFEDHFPSQNSDSLKSPRTCPFRHTPLDDKASSIYDIRPLTDNGWSIPHGCPANIPMSASGRYRRVSAATLRITSAIKVAEKVGLLDDGNTAIVIA